MRYEVAKPDPEVRCNTSVVVFLTSPCHCKGTIVTPPPSPSPPTTTTQTTTLIITH